VAHASPCGGLFSDLDLSEAKKAHFKSVHDCFTRELKEGVPPIDPDPRVLVSPCDALVGACGRVSTERCCRPKASPILSSTSWAMPSWCATTRMRQYATLRLTSSMYHRFHAPADCRVEQVNYISGDTWNVNPIALKRVERLFCKNERAVIRCRLPSGAVLTLVPVAAILVASMRLRFLDVLLHLRYRGPNVIPCDAELRRGEEMGWFEHGSTIIVFAPRGASMSEGVTGGGRIRMGEALMRIDGIGTSVMDADCDTHSIQSNL
jgi:phosphatidylserine decarboxylase